MRIVINLSKYDNPEFQTLRSVLDLEFKAGGMTKRQYKNKLAKIKYIYPVVVKDDLSPSLSKIQIKKEINKLIKLNSLDLTQILKVKVTKTEYELDEESIKTVRSYAGLKPLSNDISARNCLSCSTTFESEGIHHRMCRICANADDAMLSVNG